MTFSVFFDILRDLKHLKSEFRIQRTMAYLQYLLLRSLGLFVNLLPEGFSLWVGRQLGRIAFYLDRDRRQVALQNLRTAFSQEKSEKEIHLIAQRTFMNLGMTAVEFFRIPKMDVENVKKKVTVEGLENAQEVLNNKKKGVLLLLSHFGNWELMGMIPKIMHHPVSVIAKPVKNSRIDRWVTDIREGAGVKVIPSEKGGKKVIEALRENRLVGILIDQRAKRSEGIWVDFFGKKAPTTPAVAVLAARIGVPVIPVFMIRNGNRQHRLVVKEPLKLVKTGEIKKDVEANTQLMNQTLESMIRQYPDQWFWVHRRWERKMRVRHRASREAGKRGLR
jgi:Kdo2-lipid IVA lauroyltransferase/acyltransferase